MAEHATGGKRPSRSSQSARAARARRRRRRRLFVAAVLILLATLLIVGLVALIHKEYNARRNPGATDPSGQPTVPAVTQVPDTTPPVIEGVQELHARQGGTARYLTGVTVTDDRDPNVKVMVEADSVDLRVEGDYPVTYWAVDAAGNRAEIQTVLHVRADYVDEEIVSNLAREVIDEILTEDMTPLQKLETIYHWMHRHVHYRNALCPTEPLPAAFHGLSERWGDCQVYQYTTKALLDAAGIKNRLIDTVPLYDLHCWNLVDIGEGWMHFDTTVFHDGQNFCYVDTATLTARSKGYASSHRFDTERFPDVN